MAVQVAACLVAMMFSIAASSQTPTIRERGLALGASLELPSGAANPADPAVYSDAWEGYRLGDMVVDEIYRKDTSNGEDFHITHFPGTIAADYLLATHGTVRGVSIDWATLMAVVEAHRLRRTDCTPSKDSLVVHLRVGDVVDGGQNEYSVDELLAEQRRQSPSKAEWSEYSRPASYYEKLVAGAYSAGWHRVVIVAGGLRLGAESQQKSMEYIRRVRAIFEGVQPPLETIEARIGGDPDCAFMLLAGGAYVCPAGGGFSWVASNLARRAGAKVYR